VSTQNVMVACNFDVQFIFVWAGWESSAYDTQIFLEVIDNPHIKVLKPPEGSNMCVSICYVNFLFAIFIFIFISVYVFTGKYYLVDSG